MIGFFLQATNDTIAAATGAVVQNIVKENEISVLEFILKGGFFLIPISLLLFYTIYVIVERYIYLRKHTKYDTHLMKDIRIHLNSGNIDMAIATAEKDTTASGNVIKEGIYTIGRPIAEIESNMEKVANIEIGQMERRLGHLGLIAGIAPTLGFIGTIGGVIKIFYSISITENISIGNISGGLYEKMISSGAGLLVGIIAYSAYHLFNGVIDSFSLNIQRHVLEFVNIIQRPNATNKTK
jgi:biopolymer transport protein ExbB